MSIEFFFRLFGMVIFAVTGARIGVEISGPLELPSEEATGVLLSLVGALAGLILTPWFTTRPARRAYDEINRMSAPAIVGVLIGLFSGLLVGALAAWPLSFLPQPFGWLLPTAVLLFAIYLGVVLFVRRARELLALFGIHMDVGASPHTGQARQILMDTSVIIDGRIADICQTGFVSDTLLVPRFVLAELQHIADSSDTLRRNRGKRGLEILSTMQRDSPAPIKIVDLDMDDISEVDDKLVMLGKQINAPVLTNDYNLNRVAKLQGVVVLNVNELANAIKAVLLPGEKFVIRVIQEGRELNQGVGYLDDGTMVVVEEGKRHIDRSLEVIVTRTIQTAAGRMIFAKPA